MDETKHTGTGGRSDDALDVFFDAARAAPEAASEALMARVMGDALAVQAAAAESAVPDRGRRLNIVTGMWAALGGWPALGGLATATLAGVWIGFSPNLGVSDAMANALGNNDASSYVFDLTSDFGFTFAEGDAG
ncbi:hypothetical protein N4R57_14685 [Rhodobacteraceae bacterium D3-12]|nr:hypothetical protein N4R57_14685 [Rhodobacteraceae bacterium D3-12]